MHSLTRLSTIKQRLEKARPAAISCQPAASQPPCPASHHRFVPDEMNRHRQARGRPGRLPTSSWDHCTIFTTQWQSGEQTALQPYLGRQVCTRCSHVLLDCVPGIVTPNTQLGRWEGKVPSPEAPAQQLMAGEVRGLPPASFIMLCPAPAIISMVQIIYAT